MSKSTSSRTYGRQSKRSKAPRTFIELAQSPVRAPPTCGDEGVSSVTKKLESVRIEEGPPAETRRFRTRPPAQGVLDGSPERHTPRAAVKGSVPASTRGGLRRAKRGKSCDAAVVDTPPAELIPANAENATKARRARSNQSSIEVEDFAAAAPPPGETSQEGGPTPQTPRKRAPTVPLTTPCPYEQEVSIVEADGQALRILAWDDVCPPGDRIDKIAEASSAEVYRVTNTRGTSIIKVIRLPSPIKPQTKTQINARLVDEVPQSAEDVRAELQISEWLADIPGFVVYKERYIVQGKATKELLETHQKFQRRMKRQDKGRAQFYPSPSRYLAETKFLVVELGDAGTALEDWKLDGADQLWDIFFLEAIALARAEETAMFEHRDLHEGNLCVRQRSPRSGQPLGKVHQFGHSGLDITILDYGLSRAEDLTRDDAPPIAYDLEKCLDLFTSTYASQCKVYRQMRSFLLRADRQCLPPEEHDTPYARGIDGPISWDVYAPYTNVLWLAYLYKYLCDSFKGEKGELAEFRETTREMWTYLDPEAEEDVPCFGSAADIVHFAVESGWVTPEQLMDAVAPMVEEERSIILTSDPGDDGDGAMELRRSPRRLR